MYDGMNVRRQHFKYQHCFMQTNEGRKKCLEIKAKKKKRNETK